ncbi:hypothetical protein [Butyrivibrio sp. INlla14]|jgi:hypothetical protein|uniref:hypothetical protein n=1 Tax=Butyrivibrio sp. INlla14 TaxID=1520808 RepID=UPI0008760712|nr:hypothetical protein [Butyrivibrio sp. INlla14]SCY44096.1 hypothetical protein SAMN02910371_02290 [Butyrivibrio sp. INlla14]
MALDKLGGYLNNYNAYNIPPAVDNNVKVGDLEKVQVQPNEQPKKELQQEEPKKGLDLTVEEIPVRENASIENIAISFGQYDSSSIDLFGEKGLASEDMKQAISGMQKDKILHEYQYFVGGKDMTGKQSNIITGTEDGLVIKL